MAGTATEFNVDTIVRAALRGDRRGSIRGRIGLYI